MHDSLALARQSRKTLALTRVNAPVRRLLDRYRLLSEIGIDHCYQSNRDAPAAYQSASHAHACA